MTYWQDHWTRMNSKEPIVRAVEVHHVQHDTFAIIEDGEVSLSDGATLTLLLKQLSGRDSS